MTRPPVPTRSLDQLEHNLFGGILHGIDGHLIEVQARFFGRDEPGKSWDIGVTGMAGGAVSEVVGRISGAFARYGLQPLKGEILINLAPAGLPKFGTSLDVPIALICLQAAGYLPDLPPEVEKSFLFLGELSLHGEVRRIQGALPIALCAKAGTRLIVPKGNEKECCMIRGLSGHESTHVYVAENLEQIILQLRGKGKLPNAMQQVPKYEGMIPQGPDFGSVKGQLRAKRALLIAAAGGHNVLMVGPPGEGKSLLASAMPTILPPLNNPEKIELTRIYSAKGLLKEDGLVVSRRPFRPVHSTASKQSLIGGGSGVPEPGEITLAHRGVLFLDELAEFSRSTIESLRQPIESGFVTLSRVGATLSFPTQFTLVAAMNPCPCGYLGQFTCEDCRGASYDRKAGCSRCGGVKLRPRCDCKPTQVSAYQKKISGPILDRIDLHVELRPLSLDEKFGTAEGPSSADLRKQVVAAREIQDRRFASQNIPYNAAIPGGQISQWCEFSPSGFERYKTAINQGNFSTRATDRMAKLGRTLADLDVSLLIEDRHVSEAVGFLTGTPLG